MRTAARPQARHIHFHMYFIVVGVFLWLIGDTFLSEGISQQGLANAIYSRHITSMELYDFWSETDQLPSIDREYMPLGYILEGWLMQNVSDSFLLEKVISLLLFIFCGYMVVYIWHLSGKEWRTGWIPLAFWLLVPIVSRAATQNLSEIPHTLFALIALSSQMKLYRYRNNILEHNLPVEPRVMGITSLVYNTGTALWLAIAFFFKGFASIYCFLFPAVVWIFSMREKVGNPLKGMGIIFAAFAIFVGGTCLCFPTVGFLVNEYMRYHLDLYTQIGHWINHVSIYWTAIKQMGLGFAALLVVWVISMIRGKYGSYMTYWKHKEELKEYEYNNIRNAYIFFGCAFLGVFTVAFEQNPQVYSLFPALPMVAFGCAFVAHDSVMKVCNRSTDIINGVLATAAVASITIGMVANFNQIGQSNRNDHIISDLHTLLPLINDNELISVTPELYRNEEARNYFLRYKNITFDTLQGNRILLSLSPHEHQRYGEEYKRVPVSTWQIYIYLRKVKSSNVLDAEGEWDFAYVPPKNSTH